LVVDCIACFLYSKLDYNEVMIKNAIKLLFLGVFVVVLMAGCDEKKTFVVRPAKMGPLTQLFKEYVGINGFRIAYKSETKNRAVYRVYAGRENVIIPAKTTTLFVKKTIETKDGKATAGRATTIERPAESVDYEWYFVVYFTQKNGRVFVNTTSTGGIFPNQYIVNLVDYFGRAGYVLKEVPLSAK